MFGFIKSKKKTLTPVNGAFPAKSKRDIARIQSHIYYSHICLEWPIGYHSKELDVERWIIRRIGRGKRVLDTGCANGTKSEKIAKAGNDVFAIDSWIEGVKKANSRKGVKALRVDMNSQLFPFRDGFFDFVFSHDVYEHILDWAHYLSECYRVIKTGGELILVTPNRFNLGNSLKILMGSWEWKFNDYRLWSAHMVRRTLVLTGFTVIMYPEFKIALFFK